MKIVLVLTSLLAVGFSLTCYDCTNLENKDYCTTSKECTQGADTCYTLTATKSSGVVFYNLGCGYSDPDGCTCTEGLACDGDMACCFDNQCNSKGLAEGEIDIIDPTPKPVTEPQEVKIKTESPLDDTNKNYNITEDNDNKTSLEPEVIEGKSTGEEEPSSAQSWSLIPSAVFAIVLVLRFY